MNLVAPQVSVILPVYNGQRFLAETVESVLNQSEKDLEILIWNDGSRDDSAKMIRDFAKADSRIRFIDESQNRGIEKVFPALLKECRGKYVAQLGHDDVWRPDFLNQVIGAMEARPDASVCFSDIEVIDANSRLQNHKFVFRHDNLLRCQVEVAGLLLDGNFLAACSALIRNEFLKPLISKLPELMQVHDLWLWQQLVLQGPFLFHPHVLAAYRVHDANLSIASVRARTNWVELQVCRDAMLHEPKLLELLNRGDLQINLRSFVTPFLSRSGLINAELFPLLSWTYRMKPLNSFPHQVHILQSELLARFGAFPAVTKKDDAEFRLSFPKLAPASYVFLLMNFRSHDPLLASPLLKISAMCGHWAVVRVPVMTGSFPKFWILMSKRSGMRAALERAIDAKQTGIVSLVKTSLKLWLR